MNRPYKVTDPFSILFVDRLGKLRRAFCPFFVRCRSPVDNYVPSQMVAVEMVKSNGKENSIEFLISGRTYQHSSFEIVF
jgi:hypothetical protein